MLIYKVKGWLVFVIYSVLSASLLTPAYALDKFITIGTAGVTGVYYPAGGAICRLVNQHRQSHGVRCSVESTGGSIYNINNIRNADLDMGVVQSDWQYHAYQGSSEFKKQGAFKELRSLFTLHSEPFTVVARAESGIKNFQDLKGKRVNIGNVGSGQRATMDVLMKALGWSNADFDLISELKTSKQSKALCNNEIDAMVITVGHPSRVIKEASKCRIALVNVTGPEVDQLIKDNDFYRSAVIPAGMYDENPNDITTFGVSATLVSSSRMDDETAYHVVKSVFENFDDFTELHPALTNLNKRNMVEEGVLAPLHAGALKYYKEAGLYSP